MACSGVGEEGSDVGTNLDKGGKSNDLLSLDFRSYKGALGLDLAISNSTKNCIVYHTWVYDTKCSRNYMCNGTIEFVNIKRVLHT